MRLTHSEIQAIKESIAGIDNHAHVYFFGSRLDDKKRGGDIDLLIMSHHMTQQDISFARRMIWKRIGEQKIDLVLAKDRRRPFVRLALAEAILL
jgi:uncharacterized protein